MQKLVFVVVGLLVANLCHAQSGTPTLKGHALGETIDQFIANSTELTRQQIGNCIVSRGVGPHGITDFHCQDFLKATRMGPGTGSFDCNLAMYEIGVCRDFRGRVTFEGGKLVEIHLEVTDQDWDSVLNSAIQKFGKPDETHVVTTQNAYGAKWELRRASWSASDHVAKAYEKVNLPYNAKVFVELDLMSKEHWDEQNKSAASQNPLD